MDTQKLLVTREQLCKKLGISRSTLYRRLKETGLKPPKGLLSPLWQAHITRLFVGTHPTSPEDDTK